ncbi:MAG: UDP-N-acetylmuramate dehydrogenase [Desulfuromonadales bacterium]|nr:UDP-N-acetylmuramate dehydrogenase [Desulfuromonadales bacterium]
MSTTPAYIRALQQLAADVNGATLFDEPLSGHNSWRIGGPADLLIEPETSQQVAAVVRFARSNEIPLVVIGQGTNLLFDDAGVRGIVMKIGARMAQVRFDCERIVAGGGLWVPQLARLSMRAGLSGLEHCIGIPGTLGGLVVMNGGSRRKGIGENVRSVWIVNAEGEEQQLGHHACRFSYRHSALQGSGAVVVKVELECQRGEISEIRREMVCDLRERRHKFPRKQPNCGSVFLSSAEMHATVGPPGRIIEEAGLKGTCIGRAVISPQHANFIVNLGGASSSDVLSLVRMIRQRVRQQIGFELDCEVRYVSPHGLIIPAHQQAERRPG